MGSAKAIPLRRRQAKFAKTRCVYKGPPLHRWCIPMKEAATTATELNEHQIVQAWAFRSAALIARSRV